jgi:hypothetical protein
VAPAEFTDAFGARLGAGWDDHDANVIGLPSGGLHRKAVGHHRCAGRFDKTAKTNLRDGFMLRRLKRLREFRFIGASFVSTAQASFQRRERRSNGASVAPTARASFQRRERRFDGASAVSTARVPFQRRECRFNLASFVPTGRTSFEPSDGRFNQASFVPSK